MAHVGAAHFFLGPQAENFVTQVHGEIVIKALMKMKNKKKSF